MDVTSTECSTSTSLKVPSAMDTSRPSRAYTRDPPKEPLGAFAKSALLDTSFDSQAPQLIKSQKPSFPMTLCRPRSGVSARSWTPVARTLRRGYHKQKDPRTWDRAHRHSKNRRPKPQMRKKTNTPRYYVRGVGFDMSARLLACRRVLFHLKITFKLVYPLPLGHSS